MKKTSLFGKLCLAAGLAVLPTFTACSSDEDDNKTTDERKVNELHIAFASGSGSESATLVQGVSDLTQGAVSAIRGYQLESSRTARIFASADGTTLWSLNYTQGTVEKLVYQGGDKYTQTKRVDPSLPLGTPYLRFTKLNDKLGSLHYIDAKASYTDENDPTTYQGHKMTASIGFLNLDELTLQAGFNKNIDVAIDSELAKQGYYVSRIDCPVISGGKLYYGANLRKYNPTTKRNGKVDKSATLVVDYPALTNAKVILNDQVAGASNGYRTPTQHVNEQGEILQLISGTGAVHIVKLVNGKYTGFDFDLSKALGKGSASNGFFYAGNGIAYIPYEDLSRDKIQIGVDPDGEPTFSAMWKLARVDLNKGTAIDLNVPDNLWLTQYQNAVVRNGKFYIALSPIGTDGNVYIFDVNSESAQGTLGATLKGTGADQYFIGIY